MVNIIFSHNRYAQKYFISFYWQSRFSVIKCEIFGGCPLFLNPKCCKSIICRDTLQMCPPLKNKKGNLKALWLWCCLVIRYIFTL